MANTMEDAKAIRKAVDETKKIVQIAVNAAAVSNYIRANEFIKSGKFGDIVMVEMDLERKSTRALETTPVT